MSGNAGEQHCQSHGVLAGQLKHVNAAAHFNTSVVEQTDQCPVASTAGAHQTTSVFIIHIVGLSAHILFTCTCTRQKDGVLFLHASPHTNVKNTVHCASMLCVHISKHIFCVMNHASVFVRIYLLFCTRYIWIQASTHLCIFAVADNPSWSRSRPESPPSNQEASDTLGDPPTGETKVRELSSRS